MTGNNYTIQCAVVTSPNITDSATCRFPFTASGPFSCSLSALVCVFIGPVESLTGPTVPIMSIYNLGTVSANVNKVYVGVLSRLLTSTRQVLNFISLACLVFAMVLGIVDVSCASAHLLSPFLILL